MAEIKENEPMAYIARKECGCLVMACVDTPEHRRETAKVVAQAIRDGYTVQRVSCDFVRTHWHCPEHEAKEITKQVTLRLKGLD